MSHMPATLLTTGLCWRSALALGVSTDDSLDGVLRAYVHTDYSSYNP